MIAFNKIGDSLPSKSSIEKYTARVPFAPGPPVSMFAKETKISIRWSTPTFDGGAPIIDYEVEMNDGDGGPFKSIGFTGEGLK